jgi:glutaredoxin
MKITVYTINDCQFSKAEKDYLLAHNLPYEEKNLETNKEYLTEMLAIANNFAGTPVTKVEKDDGQISVLKGFTKEEFDKLTGVGQPQVAVVNSTMNVPAAAPTDKPVEPPKTEPILATPPVEETPKKDEALNSVLNNLQSKAEVTEQPSAPATNPPTTNLPNVPEPDFK